MKGEIEYLPLSFCYRRERGAPDAVFLVVVALVRADVPALRLAVVVFGLVVFAVAFFAAL